MRAKSWEMDEEGVAEGNYKSDLVDITCKLIHQTERAILINDGTKEVWIAKTHVEVTPIKDRLVEVTMPEWLAHREGLI
jgi:hypothetical protein